LKTGEIERISGAVITATGLRDVFMGEVMMVGDEGLVGEVVQISEQNFTMQVYEPTSGLKPGEKVISTGARLIAELGPGLITDVMDGIERPLEEILKKQGPFLSRGIKVNALPRNKKWQFNSVAKKGEIVEEGDILGEVQETRMIVHKIMVPPRIRGKLVEITSGKFTVDEPVAVLEESGEKKEMKMMQEWPVRDPRPFKNRLTLDKQLVSGQRVIDVLFPIAKGGTASIPGGFGTGKTVMLQQLIKWSDADVTVYVGCGERGNEICEVITDFPKLKDPKNGLPLMERTIIIANTSNMPVSAREASVYMGVTIGEYYRDMGYHVALVADSTSRWAEALREISGRLGEMPSEKGYPAYLAGRIGEFYERAGRVEAIGKPDREGSITVIGAVSPPGGDFNEPVTISTARFTGVFWALDTDLAYSRHFPAINWTQSYSLYAGQLAGNWVQSFSALKAQEKEPEMFWEEKFPAFKQLRSAALGLLTESAEIEAIARVIGETTLPDDQRLILQTAQLIKEGFLKQNAYDEIDSFCNPSKQVALLGMILRFHVKAETLIKKQVPIEKLMNLPIISKMKRIKEDKGQEIAILQLIQEIDMDMEEIRQEYQIEF
jgi:V/A-type H+-transporting ATPase subunit A